MAGDDQQDVPREGVPRPEGNVVIQYPRHVDAPNYNAGQYHPPPPPVSDSPRCDIEPSDRDTLHSIRRFHMCTCLGMSESPKLS